MTSDSHQSKEIQELTLENPKQFNSLLEDMSQKSKTRDNEHWLAYFVGGIDPQTGESWCDDCAMKQRKSGKGSLPVVKCIVQTKKEWKANKNHPFRTHPQLRLSGLPSIAMFKRDRKIAVLTQDEIYIGSLLRKLVNLQF